MTAIGHSSSWPRSQRTPSRQLLLPRPPLLAGRLRRAVLAGDQEDEPGGHREGSGVEDERAARSSSESRRLPTTGPTKVLATSSALHMRPLARSSRARVDEGGHERLAAVVPQHLGHAEAARWRRASTR